MLQVSELNKRIVSFLDYQHLTIASLVSKNFRKFCRTEIIEQLCNEISLGLQNKGVELTRLETLFSKAIFIEGLISKFKIKNEDTIAKLLIQKSTIVERALHFIKSEVDKVRMSPELQKAKEMSENLSLSLATRNQALSCYLDASTAIRHSLCAEDWEKRRTQLIVQKKNSTNNIRVSKSNS